MLRNLVVCCFMLLLSACYQPPVMVKKYNPAMVSVNLGYMPRPTSFDSTKSAVYISGGFMKDYPGFSPVNDSEDMLNLGVFSVNRGLIYKNVNFAYGADFFAGSFKNKSLEASDPGYFNKKSVSGVKFKSSLNYFQTIRSFDFRIIGFDLAYSKEFGDFAKFRQVISNTENRFAIPATSLLSGGLSSEIIFKTRKSFIKRYGFGINLRTTFNDLNYQGVDENGQKGGTKSGFAPSWSIYVQTKHLYFVGESSKNGSMNLGYKF